MSHAQIKSLEVRKNDIENDIKLLKGQREEINKRIEKEESQLKNIKNQLETIRKRDGGIVITEHAILRYLERVKGINLETAKEEILSPKAREIALTLNNGKIPSGNHKVILKNNRVVSVVPND